MSGWDMVCLFGEFFDLSELFWRVLRRSKRWKLIYEKVGEEIRSICD